MPLTIVTAMARTLWTLAWATHQEEHGESLSGAELTDIAPHTPIGATYAAMRLAGMYEQANGACLASLYLAAMRADGIDTDGASFTDDYAERFGSDLAMMAMGHGVSWFDNHAPFALTLPRIEGGIAYEARGEWFYE